jgi:SAM-dependent methyltransferase
MKESNDYSCVADLYDTYVPVVFDIPFFLTEAKKSSGHVLELMSGTGRVSLPLAQAGVQLTCVDLSADMLEILRGKLKQAGLKADLHSMDIRELNLSRLFDLILVPFHSFAEITSLDDQRRVLARIFQHLSPGGRFICTLGNATTKRPAFDGKLQLIGKNPLENGQGTLVSWILREYNPADEDIVQITEFFEEYDLKGTMRSKRLLELQYRLSRKEEFQTLATAAGFRVIALYGDYTYSEFHPGDSRYMVWILGKEHA